MLVLEPGSFPPITLAPILAKKGLKLPVALLEASGSPYWERLKILRAFGLSAEQANLLQLEIVGLEDFDGVLDLCPKFEAIPNDPRLPFVRRETLGVVKNDFSGKKDVPEFGRIFYDMCVWLGAPSAEIEEQ